MLSLAKADVKVELYVPDTYATFSSDLQCAHQTQNFWMVIEKKTPPQRRTCDEDPSWHWTRAIPSVPSVHWGGAASPNDRQHLAIHCCLANFVLSSTS